MTGAYSRVVVGTDGSDTAAKAVAKAAALAAACGAELLIATVNSGETGDDVLDVARASVEPYGVAVRVRQRDGDPADALIGLAAAEEADVIVVGNKGMTGAARFLLGSVPNRVSHRSHCDVLIVHTVNS